jgi:hypothetical protein
MRIVAHIFGGIPLLGPITPLLGWAKPLFGGARLPNSLEANNSGDGFCDDMMRLPRLTRRAVGTRTMHLLRVKRLHPLGTFYVRRWHTLGRRLGAFLSFDLIEGLQASTVSGRSLGRSGASPHQLWGNDIPQGMLTSSRFFDHSGLMTNTKTFVLCLNPFPVSL